VELRLKYVPEPANAPRFAADAVASAARGHGVTLDYGVESLAAVDALMDALRADGASIRQVAGTLFGLGCYVGEVLVRNTSAAWRAPDELEPARRGWPMVVGVDGRDAGDPIGKVFRRFEKGDEGDLRAFYGLFAEPAGDRAAGAAGAAGKQ
jgi:hypothetical protein